MTTVLRSARDDESDAVAALVGAAFSAEPLHRPQVTSPDREAVVRRVVEDGASGRLLATASARLCGQWWGGRRVPAAALAGVAVDLTARGRGVGLALVAGTFAAARESGALLVALVPSTHAFYRKGGCGIAGRRSVYAVGTHDLRTLPRDPSLTYRPAGPGDADAVAGLVAARGARTDGVLDHDERTGSAVPYVALRAGAVVGWCALGRRPARPGAGGNYAVVVHDLVGADPAAELGLWRDLAADEPSAREVHALVSPGGLLEHHLPRQTEVVEDATWMLGLLDVPGALGARGYPAGVRGTLALAVQGSGRTDVLTLDVAGGRATVGSGTAPAGAGTVRLGAADLASVYAGHLDPVTAHHLGFLEGDADAIALLRSLFAGPPAVLDRPF
ncbi:GNAT family N-acetyltransferase [Kineococcus rhizosphaerae]|uniref:Putative acetyltransferase n=1 Tax=Kineococcus rhizosphaerae TaxID=559628 RepID=A0A2T0R3G7_9ACTN|nr:GNAT family N-acetyltransferase [Kineococcus rhizosphaerae]PRY14592.1 putative acetyltransferase [Kineococcus rhizosphaerae]